MQIGENMRVTNKIEIANNQSGKFNGNKGLCKHFSLFKLHSKLILHFFISSQKSSFFLHLIEIIMIIKIKKRILYEENRCKITNC